MNFFKRNKKENNLRVVWRSPQGKIECPGDNCPQACDERCPIWLNTRGLMYLQIKEPQKAIEPFQKALRLAPDFVDVLNNLGSAYGMNGQHQEAYEMFLRACQERPGYDKALHGLIVAEINLKKYDDALKHCDEYDRLPNCDSSALRAKMKNEQKSSQKDSFVAIGAELLEEGKRTGLIPQDCGAPYVPELLVLAEDTCLKLNEVVRASCKAYPRLDSNTVTMLWCVYAGIGAVYHWHTAWGALSQNGIFETLTKDCDIDSMDDYVLGLIGKPQTSEEGKELASQLFKLAQYAEFRRIGAGKNRTLIETAKAMFFVGMIWEMYHLNMR